MPLVHLLVTLGEARVMKPTTAVVKDDIYLQHFTGDSHPESHHRLEVIYDMLKDEDMLGTFKELSPRAAVQDVSPALVPMA